MSSKKWTPIYMDRLSSEDPDNVLCEYCKFQRIKSEEKPPSISYLPTWRAKSWETAKSSWKKPPAYGAYMIGDLNPNWSAELHDTGLILDQYSLANIFRHGMYLFYVHMILLNEFKFPFLLHVSPSTDATTYYPHYDKKTRMRYEQFVKDTMVFLELFYQDLEPLGIIYERWKIVEEFLDKKNLESTEVIFLKDSIQTLIRTILETLIKEYFCCIREKNIRSKTPNPKSVESHIESFCLVPSLGLKEPKKQAMYDFLIRNKSFLQKPFPKNNLNNKHYKKFVEKLQPELDVIMRIPF